MTGEYDTQDLLSLMSNEGAWRLVLGVGKPPSIWLRGEEHLIEGPPVTPENAVRFLQVLATSEQLQELHSCGDVRFIYTSPNATRFRVIARVEHGRTNVEIRNLAVPGAWHDTE